MKVRDLLAKIQPLLAVSAGLGLGLLVTAIAGENPFHVLKVLGRSAFGSTYDLAMTLFYTAPLIFTGLSVAIAFQAGMFNIGAEGQLYMGAFGAAAVGALMPGVPWPLAPLLAILACVVCGGVWGGLAGWLRARRGSHEVIVTIMLNFVAAGLTSWATLYWLKNPDSQNPETRLIGAGYLLSKWTSLGDAPLSHALTLALVVAVGVALVLNRTVFGFELRAVGQNETASRMNGIDTARVRIQAMFLAGAVAGLVGVVEVLGNVGKFRMGFSPDFGFIGIAVALLARGRPLAIVASALLFGALHKGAADLDLETENVTRDLSLILEALIILCVSADGLWTWARRRSR